MWKAKITASGLIFILLCSSLSFGCSKSVPNTSKALLYTDAIEQDEIETTKVKKKVFIQDAFATGSLYYTKQNSIRLDIENATIKSVKVKVGDKVKKGDLVATFKVSIIKSEIERERLEIENERNAFHASYKSLQNQILEWERVIKNMKGGKEKKEKQNECKQLREQLKYKKNEETAIIEREKRLSGKIQNSKKTKLYSKYSGVVTKVLDSEEYEYSRTGMEVAVLCTKDDFMIQLEKDNTEREGLLRYNTEVTIALGGDRNDIRHRIKGKVISADNLAEEDREEDDGGSSGSTLIRVSEADRKNYDFEENNIYVEYEKIRVENCLIVEKDAIYTETDGEEKKYYVFLMVEGNLFKRYIARALTHEELAEEEWILQGVEEGQELAKNVG